MRDHLKDARKPRDPLNLRKRLCRLKPAVAVLAIGASALTLSYRDIQISADEQRRQTIVTASVLENHQRPRRFEPPVVLSVVVFLTSGTSWLVAADFGILTSVECIGGGGSSSGGNTSTAAGEGGAGGAYVKIVSTSTTLTAGVTNIGYGVSAGGDTWWNATSLANAVTLGSAVACAAQKGAAGAVAGTGGTAAGGLAASSVGTTKFSGGSGTNDPALAGGGGGGPAGPSGPGGNAPAGGSVGGTGNNGNRAANTAGSATTDCATAAGSGATQGNGTGAGAGVAGKIYGGGAAGGGVNNATGGAASLGIIVISYTPAVLIPWAGYRQLPVFLS